MERYYLDTCIWLDLYEKRGSDGEHACRFVEYVFDTGGVLLYSDANLTELKRIGYSLNEITHIFATVQQVQVRRVHISKEQIIEARSLVVLYRASRGDCLHAVLARDNHAVLITRDSDFERLHSITHAQKPEEIY